MTTAARYMRLLLALARYGIARELAFRANFLVKISVEVLWLLILLAFYKTVFAKTRLVADWTESQYLFFVGCYFALEGIVETFFLENCNEFADLIRTGDLDFYLLKPIDEQFLVTCRKIDWSTAPNLLMGAAVMVMALWQMGWAFDPGRALVFLVMFGCGICLAYGFLLVLTSMSMWFMRNQSLFELWWLFTSLMRYPKEIFSNTWASPLGLFFTFVIPVLLVVNVPARVMVKALDEPWTIGFTVVATVALLVGSRRFFRYALRLYRSASS
jgi:ABC-2 type transport system permease protein